MADFNVSFKKLLHDEGGYVDDKADPGGATNLGISLNFLKGMHLDINGDSVIDSNDVRDITYDIASKIYKDNFWKGINNIKSQDIADILFGMRVNMGLYQANKLMQESVNFCLDKDILICDGNIGMASIGAINNTKVQDLLQEYKLSLQDYYEEIIDNNSTLAKFKQGWFNRLDSYA